ncbi:phage tail sheath protein, partial [mine drainage metagenome]
MPRCLNAVQTARDRGRGGFTVGYVASNSDGDDGGPLTDYDVIGSAADGTGLFALRTEVFDFLCIPPLSREQDVGLGTLLVAARLCRECHALLIVDPPSDWTCPQEAIEAMRNWPFRSDHAVLYYPRLRAFDRLRGRHETFACCGAAAGLLARAEAYRPLGSRDDEAVLRAGLLPAVDVSPAQRVRLAQAGIN